MDESTDTGVLGVVEDIAEQVVPGDWSQHPAYMVGGVVAVLLTKHGSKLLSWFRRRRSGGRA